MNGIENIFLSLSDEGHSVLSRWDIDLFRWDSDHFRWDGDLEAL